MYHPDPLGTADGVHACVSGCPDLIRPIVCRLTRAFQWAMLVVQVVIGTSNIGPGTSIPNIGCEHQNFLKGNVQPILCSNCSIASAIKLLTIVCEQTQGACQPLSTIVVVPNTSTSTITIALQLRHYK